MPRSRQAGHCSVACKKRLHLHIAFGLEDGAGAIDHTTAWLQQRPQRIEQLGLDGGELGHIAFAAQPAHIGLAANNARGRTWCIQQNGIKRQATALRLKPVLRLRGIGHHHLGLQTQTSQRLANAAGALGVNFQRGHFNAAGRGVLQQVSGLAAGGGTGIQHAQGAAFRQCHSVQQQRGRSLGCTVLYRGPAFFKVRQLLHGSGMLQLKA